MTRERFNKVRKGTRRTPESFKGVVCDGDEQLPNGEDCSGCPECGPCFCGLIPCCCWVELEGERRSRRLLKNRRIKPLQLRIKRDASRTRTHQPRHPLQPILLSEEDQPRTATATLVQ